MTDNDVTLPEVYRAIKAIDGRLEKAIEERDRAEHSMRNRIEATNVKVAVLENRTGTLEAGLKDVYTSAGKIAIGLSTGIGLLFTGIQTFWKRP